MSMRFGSTSPIIAPPAVSRPAFGRSRPAFRFRFLFLDKWLLLDILADDGVRGSADCVSLNTSSRLTLSSRPQLRAPKAWVDPIGAFEPEAAIRLRDRIDLALREVQALLAQSDERFDWTVEEIRAKLLVREDLADDELHDLLRHFRDPWTQLVGRPPDRSPLSQPLQHTREGIDATWAAAMMNVMRQARRQPSPGHERDR